MTFARRARLCLLLCLLIGPALARCALATPPDERAAAAEAKATQLVSDAIAEGNVQAINYFIANNYVKALESLAKAPNQKVIMMPLEASSVIGSVAGLAQITSEAFGSGASGSTPPRGSGWGSVPQT